MFGWPVIFPAGTGDGEEQGQRYTSPWLVVTLVTVLALAIRLAWLGSKSLWVDEADSIYFAGHPFPDLFSRLCDPHPPGYYALLRVSLALGQSEFWVRLPSAIAGALAVPLLYILDREIGAALGMAWQDRRTAILASLLLAVAPLHVWYSQEARMYALVTTLGLCAVIFGLRFALRRHAKEALGYTLAASAALYADQSSVLPLLLANLLWGGLWLRRHRMRMGVERRDLVVWVGLQMVVGVTFWLWSSQALYASLFDAGTLYQLAMVMLVLQRLGLPVTLADVRHAFVVGGVASLVAGSLVCWLAMRRRWGRRLSSTLAPVMVGVFVLVTLGSAIPRGFTVKRLLVSLLPYGLLISAWAIRRLQLRRWALPTMVTCSLVLCLVNVLLVPKEPWREVVAVVQQEIAPHDVLWVDELAVPAFDYYYTGPHERRILRLAHLHELNQAQESDQGSEADGERVWVVTRVDPYRNVWDYLPSHFSQNLAWSADWHRVSVRAYALAPSEGGAFTSGTEPPSWLLAWPSPVHENCVGTE